ncbi:hypothetical protein [Parvibaculum sp.]|uniref:hypothetical protein n=1 Tax=Parvibaculum sp. TaxID=2024848 RepID=UPI00391C0DE8
MLSDDTAAIPAYAKQIRYVDAFGEVLGVHDVTELFEGRMRIDGDGLNFLHQWALANYPDDAVSYEQFVFWPCDNKWVLTTRHNRVQEHLALAAKRSPEEAARARRFARMMQGRDRL